jgi:cytochrome bd-type quinol oxidase subunit 1
MLGMAMIMAIFVAPMQLLLGDMHGLNTLEHQPVKVAAMEGLWEPRTGRAPEALRVARRGGQEPTLFPSKSPSCPASSLPIPSTARSKG